MSAIMYDNDKLNSFIDSFELVREYLNTARTIANSFDVPNYYFDYFAHSSYLSELGSKIDSVCRDADSVASWVKGSITNYEDFSSTSEERFNLIPDMEVKPRESIVVAKF